MVVNVDFIYPHTVVQTTVEIDESDINNDGLILDTARTQVKEDVGLEIAPDQDSWIMEV